MRHSDKQFDLFREPVEPAKPEPVSNTYKLNNPEIPDSSDRPKPPPAKPAPEINVGTKIDPWHLSLSIIVALTGSFLEMYYYYYFRFTMDGTPAPVAIIQAIALTAFLILAYSRKLARLWVPLVIFSVFATSAGQTNAMAKDAAKIALERSVTDVNREEIKTLEQNRERLQKAIDGIVIPRSMDTRRKYGPEVEAAMAERAGYEKDLKVVNDRISSLRPATVAPVETETSYQFYARVFGVNAEWVQIIIHTAFSVFFALMGPVAVRHLTGKKV